MAVVDDLPFLSSFIDKYGDTGATVLNMRDPFQALSEGLNKMRSSVEGRGDMAGDIQDLLLSLRNL